LESVESIELGRTIIDVISDKKGEDIVLMDLRDISVIADFFVIASANNERQINAVTEAVRQEVAKRVHVHPLHIEGTGQSGWVLIDYGDVIVHVFSPELRDYYDLEELWRDANVLVKML
jgi:ribosome-associated protein